MDVRPLREFSSGDLQEIFNEEVGQWDQQLLWDYGTTLGVVRNFIRSGSLPGCVLRDGNSIPVGYSYFVIDRPVAFIGDLFVRQGFADGDNYRLLIEATTKNLMERRQIKRIETQLFPLNFDSEEIFAGLDFRTTRRLFMTVSTPAVEPASGAPLIDGFQVRSWEPHFARACADVIYDSYRNSPDMNLCRDYQTPIGCLRFLRNLIENPACGKFNSADTLVVLDRFQRVCGILLTTNIRPDVGMIPQLSIRRDVQGRGIGTFLLSLYLNRARPKGVATVALSVSAPNERAFRLYRKMGFGVRKEFSAFIWERA